MNRNQILLFITVYFLFFLPTCLSAQSCFSKNPLELAAFSLILNNPEIKNSMNSGPCGLKRVVENIKKCQGDNYISPSGKNFIETATLPIAGLDTVIAFIDTSIVNRCDTTIHFITVSIENKQKTVNDSMCQGKTYILPNAQMVTKGGVYTVALKFLNTCDSLITTNLKLTPPYSASVNLSICQGKTHLLPDGKIVNSAGTYLVTIKAIGGCDSIVTTNLTVNSTYSKIVDAAICRGENHTLPNGNVVNTEGSFPVILKTHLGCDSLITTLLKFHPNYNNNLNATICRGNNYILPDKNIVKTSGLYPVLLKSIHGCDSLVTVNLTYQTPINTLDDAAVFTENSTILVLKVIENDAFNNADKWSTDIITPPQYGKLTETEEGHFNYQLMKPGLKTDTFRYRLCYTGCVSSCDMARVLIDIQKPAPPPSSKGIIPNGNEANRRLHFIELDNPNDFPNNELVIINRWGQVVFTAKFYQNDWEGKNQKSDDLPAGTYYYILRLNINEGKILKGDVTIIR